MNAIGIRRRLFLGNAVGVLALSRTRAAQADTTFTNFSFAATGAPTARTMPDRLSDIVNVKDWGARGNNSDDTNAIQNAINYCISQGGGKVFFPIGAYLIRNPLVVGSNSDVGVQLIGGGKNATLILAGGSFSDRNGYGYLISKGNQTYDNLEHIEGLGSISVKATRSGVSIYECSGQFDVSAALGSDIRNCNVGGGQRIGANNPNHGAPPGSVGLYLGNGAATACSALACDIAFAVSGKGASILGCRAETCNTGVKVGWGPEGETPAYGCSVENFQTEQGKVGIDLYNATGCFIGGNIITGTDGASSPKGPISNMVWNAGGGKPFVRVTTPGAHNIPAGTHRLQLQTTVLKPLGFCPPQTGPSGDQTGQIVATVEDETHFTYQDVPSNPGTFVAGTWDYALEAGIRLRKVYETVIAGNMINLSGSIASIDLDYGGASDLRNITFIGNFTRKDGWKLPTLAKNKASSVFIFSGTTANQNFYATGTPNPYATMNFIDLPGQSGVLQDGPLESQEYNIVDGQKSGGGIAAWNDIVTGGGSGHYRVRYDGANWRRIG